MIIPSADPETALTDAAPVAKVIGLPVAVGEVLVPVEPMVPMVELATPDEIEVVEVVHAKTVTVDCAAATEAIAAMTRAATLNCIVTVGFCWLIVCEVIGDLDLSGMKRV